MKVRVPKPVRKTRISYRIPDGLFIRIYDLGEKHLPKPFKNVFMEYLLSLGLDAYKEDKRLQRKYVFGGELKQLNHEMQRHFVTEYKNLADAHRPEVTRQEFLAFILGLGVQSYEKIYNQYGFKKGD